jgi:hypothetical protein
MGHYYIMNKYKEGKIYKIESNGLCYYGSTIQTLNERLSTHKKKSGCSSKLLYETGKDIIISIVELYPCNNKEELLLRERFYIENNQCINIKCPISSKEEKKQIKYKWTVEHREEKKQYDAIYREKRKDNDLQLNKCDCGGSYKTKHKSTHFKTKLHMQFYAKD